MCLSEEIQRWVSFAVAFLVMLGMGTCTSKWRAATASLHDYTLRRPICWQLPAFHASTMCLIRFSSFCSTIGTLYSYSAYSAQLMTLLSYTGIDVNIVSSIGDLGLYAGGIPVGFFFDKFGPRLTYAIAVAGLTIGYLLLWAGTTQRIPSNSVLMGFYLTFVGFGSVAGYMAGLLTNTKNFRVRGLNLGPCWTVNR